MGVMSSSVRVSVYHWRVCSKNLTLLETASVRLGEEETDMGWPPTRCRALDPMQTSDSEAVGMT
jgi:hypothetical protein